MAEDPGDVTEARRTLTQALAIGALAAAVGAAVNIPLIKRFARGEFRETFLSREDYPGIRLVTLREAEDLWASGQAVVFDARPERLFKEGHAPGARNLPEPGPGRDLPAEVAGLARERTLVVYCEGGDCQSSLALAKRLHDEGFRDIRVMTGGWEEWTKAGLPEEKDDDTK